MNKPNKASKAPFSKLVAPLKTRKAARTAKYKLTFQLKCPSLEEHFQIAINNGTLHVGSTELELQTVLNQISLDGVLCNMELVVIPTKTETATVVQFGESCLLYPL